MRVWISKYALSTGIFETDAQNTGYADMILVGQGGNAAYFHQHEWHRTREAAASRALVMRDAKLVSLRKQIGRLEKLTFEEKE